MSLILSARESVPLLDGSNIQHPPCEKAAADWQGFTIPGNSRTSFNVGTKVVDYNVSTMVTSHGGDVVCERAMYGNGRTWAHDSIGYAP